MMPTKTQYKEFIDNTDSVWTSINGVNGRKFASKTDASKYIFLPAGGLYRPSIESASSHCLFWSATRSGSYAECIFCTSSNYGTTYNDRSWGFSIRPVRQL